MAKFELLLLAMIAVSAFAYPSQVFIPAREVRAADPDPYRHHHHHSHDDYYGGGQYGGHDGYGGGNYGSYPSQNYYPQRGSNSNAQAAANAQSGAINTPFGSASYAQASANAGAGNGGPYY